MQAKWGMVGWVAAVALVLLIKSVFSVDLPIIIKSYAFPLSRVFLPGLSTLPTLRTNLVVFLTE